MDKSLFRYIWRHSRREQLIILAVVLASLPFYFLSLDLPRKIVNEAIQGKAFESGSQTAPILDLTLSLPSFLGGGSYTVFEGFPVDRLTLLFGLSGLFLLLVLINGAFKYYINVAKGALGERMLRRMRFDLFSLVLRFTPESLRTIKSSETATIVKDEVEPIGGFIGDAFILPAFLGTQALTALTFILLQNVWLGLLAGGVVGVQFAVIPRLRRELLRLGKQRQLASRRLAGRVGEVVDGVEAVHVHNAERWERAEIGNRLYELFDIRFRIFKRKFMVKFLNNLLAQITPFLFYAVGGYFALKGSLDIGQLVAVIAAYRDLPPPLKELIDWDQQRLDVQVKYDQVVQHFSPERLHPLEEPSGSREGIDLTGPLVVENLQVRDLHGGATLDGVSLTVELPARIGLVTDGTAAASNFARVVARRNDEYAGSIRIGGQDLAHLPIYDLNRAIAYAGIEPILFPGTLRDNLVYGLRQYALGPGEEGSRERARRLAEAKWTGNPVESIHDRWIDYELAGAADEDELDRILIEHLKRLGFGDDLYRFGLSGRVDPARQPELVAQIIESRTGLRAKLEAGGMADLVEPFDSECYNTQATVAENLLFGVPTSSALTGRRLAEHPGFRGALDRENLTADLVEMGARIAETMTEIFRDLPPGHPLFEQFSFIGAEELDEHETIIQRRASGGRAFRRDDATRLLALPLAYIEPRHRLGLIDDGLRDRLVAARPRVRTMLEEAGDPGVEFYDADKVSTAAPLRDNLLFGRVNHNAADAQARVTEAITAVIDELGLRDDVERVGLDHQVGPAGRLLSAPQRAIVSLVRCLVRRPQILVLDGALAPFTEGRARELTGLILDSFADRTLLMTLPNDKAGEGFDALVRFRKGKAELEERRGEPPAGQAALEEPPERARRLVAGGVS